MIVCSIRMNYKPDLVFDPCGQKGFCRGWEVDETSIIAAFLFAKTDCYGNSIGVHCVKHDGWDNPALEQENFKDFVSHFEPLEYDQTFSLLYHQRDD